MFETSVAIQRPKSKVKGIALTIAIVMHAVVILFFTIVNLLAVEPIDPPSVQVMFLSASAPPPPPPPPAPRKVAPKEAPKPVEVAKPIEVVQPEVVPEKLSKGSDTGGVEGGVEGGIEGGEEGGVAGGVVGGVEGGVSQEQITAAEADAPLLVGGDVKAPVATKKVEPRYPEVAKAARVQGRVILQAIINQKGEIEDAKVLTGPPLLHDAAVEALMQWKFKPGTLNGKPVRVRFTLTIIFKLS